MATIERIGSELLGRITGWLGDEAESLLSYTVKGIPKERLMIPGPDHVTAAWGASDRKPGVIPSIGRHRGRARHLDDSSWRRGARGEIIGRRRRWAPTGLPRPGHIRVR